MSGYYFQQVKKVSASARSGATDGYIIESVLRACHILAAFHYEGEVLRLKDLVSRTGLSSATAFRMLCTLRRGGMVERVGEAEYRSRIRPSRAGKYRIGYAFSDESPGFVQEWSRSIVRVAAERGIELIVLEHGHDLATALRNTARLIRERVDLAIDYQYDLPIAAATGSKFAEAHIPIIAMGTPRPRAIYYGPNNYGAGVMGGQYLGRWVRQNWRGKAEQLILLDITTSGPLLQMRMKGFEVGVRYMLPNLDESSIVRLQGDAHFTHSLELVREHTRRSRARRILVGAAFDHGALGALLALEEAGRSEDSAAVSLGGCVESRMELRRPGTRLVGDVAFFLDRYGEHVIGLALDILEKKPVPPAVFAKHAVLTPMNVDHYYPNDCLLNPPEPVSQP